MRDEQAGERADKDCCVQAPPRVAPACEQGSGEFQKQSSRLSTCTSAENRAQASVRLFRPVLVQGEMDNFTLQLRECLAFGKEVF